MILVVTQTFAPAQGGMEAYMTGLAAHLARAGYDVAVLADGASARARAFAPQEPYILKRFGGLRPWRRWRKRRVIESLAAAKKIDAVFCDSWKSVEALPRGIDAPVAVLAHGSEYPPDPSACKRNRIAAALARAAVIIANSRFTAGAAQAFLPRPNDPRVTIIHPPIEALNEPTPDARHKIRALLGGKTPVISTLARLEPRKGVDRVIAALPALIARHPNIVFLVGGDGADKERLQDLARQHNVADRVVFYGWVTDPDIKAAILAQSDVFAMPSYRVGASVEGFGISYVEAARFGVPALGGKNSGAEDAVIDGETGLLCDGNDQADVAAKLAALLDDENFRRRLGSAAQARARRDMMWEAVLPRLLAAAGVAAKKAAA